MWTTFNFQSCPPKWANSCKGAETQAFPVDNFEIFKPVHIESKLSTFWEENNNKFEKKRKICISVK